MILLKKILRGFGISFAVLLAVYTGFVRRGAPNIGTVLLFLIAVYLFVVFVFGARLKNAPWKPVRTGYLFVKCLFVAFCAWCVVIRGVLIYHAYFNPPPKNPDTPHTVIVLGCQVNGDTPETAYPSTMLKTRLDAALDYLADHPEDVVIVSGGQGNNEPVSEADMMRDYLVGKGIENTIFTENDSVNTEQNMRYSSIIIANNNLPAKVVIVTDAFHEYRAKNDLKKQSNITVIYSHPANTSPTYIAPNWFREICAVTYNLVFYNIYE
ncbi:MAG: YdcF family protein [Oscillospiraceae bacterium]|jgi:uncharacterized SAM-binding protein YcdF (DUF218 family)|nr:YdcF family protein [Oscillospiraceae bacterium]